MMQRLSAFVLLMISASVTVAQSAPAARVVDERAIHAGSTLRIVSRILRDEREINILLPDSYTRSGERYPVVYLLDGGSQQDFPHIAGLARLGELSGTYGPFMLVGVQSEARQAELTPPATDRHYREAFPDAGGANAFRAFLSDEVIPLIERRYRTRPRRALMGESLAGLFVVDTFLVTPGLFDDYIAISPSLWWDDRSLARRAADLLSSPRPADRRLYLTIASEGGTMQDGVDRLRAALAGSCPQDACWRYVDRSATSTHATIYHGAAEDALRWLYAAPPHALGEPPWFMVDGASPPAQADPAR